MDGGRYFPEPDLPPLVLEEGMVEQIRAALPELPDDKCRRLVTDYDLPLYDAQVLVDTYGASHFFEVRRPLSLLVGPSKYVRWVGTQRRGV
jgi:aspartyl-tRNA(Asn)/glutamyl-tRNA(Gln) amidotransferase subunit B